MRMDHGSLDFCGCLPAYYLDKGSSRSHVLDSLRALLIRLALAMAVEVYWVTPVPIPQ